MKITIHRGANQIGGCITEIATKDAKIFIDLGSNLPGSDKTDYSADEVRKITADADVLFGPAAQAVPTSVYLSVRF